VSEFVNQDAEFESVLFVRGLYNKQVDELVKQGRCIPEYAKYLKEYLATKFGDTK